MRELLVAAVELLAYAVGTVLLAGAGLFAEYNSFSYLASGNRIFAAWLAVVGGVALYAAISVGTEKLLPHLRGLQG